VTWVVCLTPTADHSLQSVLLLELQILLVQKVDSVNHGLDKLDLGVAQSVLVGNVIGDAGLAARLTAGASGLKVQLLTARLQSGKTLLGPAGKIDVDRSPHTGSKVGGARVQVSVLLVEEELLSGLLLDDVSDGGDTASQAVENATNVSTCSNRNEKTLRNMFAIGLCEES